MTDLNKQELRRLAEMASPAYEWYAPCDLRYADDKTGEVHGLDHDDDSFIAAAGPATILSLLDELDAANSRLHEVAVACATAEQERDQLRAEVEALRLDVSSLRGSCKALGDDNKHLTRRVKRLAKALAWFSGLHIGVMKPKWLLDTISKEGSANG